MSHHPRCGNGTNWTCPCTCDAEYAADTSEGRATPASAQKEPVDWALAFERLTQYAEHRVGCSANDLDPLDKTPCTCGLRAIYSPKGLPALSAHQATDEGEVERVAAIIRNWRAGNAGEDDAEDTARLILSTPTSQPPAAETRLRDTFGRFRKRPVEVDAIQWTEDNAEAVQAFLMVGEFASNGWVNGRYVDIGTLEGLMVASPGDWIIRGVKGEHYPCKPDIFEATYEPVAALTQPEPTAQQGGEEERAAELIRSYFDARQAGNDCPECGNEGPWEHCGPCSDRIGPVIARMSNFAINMDMHGEIAEGADKRDAVARIISLAKGAPENGQMSIGAWWWDKRHDRARPEHFEGECRDEDRKHADLMIPLLRAALSAQQAGEEVDALDKEALRILREHSDCGDYDGIEYDEVQIVKAMRAYALVAPDIVATLMAQMFKSTRDAMLALATPAEVQQGVAWQALLAIANLRQHSREDDADNAATMEDIARRALATPQQGQEVERMPCPDLMDHSHDEAWDWIAANCIAIRRDNGDMDYSLGAMIAAYEAGKAAAGTETQRIVDGLLDELILLAHQYRNDLIYPLADDSRERRIAAIDAVLAKTGEK